MGVEIIIEILCYMFVVWTKPGFMTIISPSRKEPLRGSLIYVPKVSVFTLRCLYGAQTGRVRDQTVFVCMHIASHTHSWTFGPLGSVEMGGSFLDDCLS